MASLVLKRVILEKQLQQHLLTNSPALCFKPSPHGGFGAFHVVQV